MILKWFWNSLEFLIEKQQYLLIQDIKITSSKKESPMSRKFLILLNLWLLNLEFLIEKHAQQNICVNSPWYKNYSHKKRVANFCVNF